MGHVRYSGHVEAPLDAAWALVSDVRRFPEWDPLICGVDAIEGAPGTVGAAFRAVLRVAGRQLDSTVETLVAEPPRRVILAGNAAADVRFTWAWRFAQVGSGIEVTVELDYDLPANLAGEAADLLYVERSVGRSLRAAVENFADLVVARQPVAS